VSSNHVFELDPVVRLHPRFLHIFQLEIRFVQLVGTLHVETLDSTMSALRECHLDMTMSMFGWLCDSPKDREKSVCTLNQKSLVVSRVSARTLKTCIQTFVRAISSLLDQVVWKLELLARLELLAIFVRY
jgi:hypothetical protein